MIALVLHEQASPACYIENNTDALENLRSGHTVSFASLPTEVVLHISAQLTLPATASLMQTCRHLRMLCFKVYKWEPHSGGFQMMKLDNARQYYRLHNMPLTSSSAGSCNTVVQSQLAEVVAEAADAANSQRYSWCPVPGQQFLQRVFSSGSKIVKPAWLSLLPRVSCEGSSWLYVKTKTVAGTPTHATGFCGFAYQPEVVSRGHFAPIYADANLRGCQIAFHHTHNAVRSQLYILWLAGEIEDGLHLQRMLLKMTRKSQPNVHASSEYKSMRACHQSGVHPEHQQRGTLQIAHKGGQVLCAAPAGMQQA